MEKSQLIQLIEPLHGIFDPSVVGGKGYELLRLTQWGFNVPPFCIIPTGNEALIDKFFSSSSEKRLLEIINLWGTDKVSIRSSVNLEDQVDTSFAGLFETYLNVNLNEIPNYLIKIKECLYSDRVKEYCTQKKIGLENLKLAIIIQKMIPAEKSGVVFSRSPIEPTSLLTIDVGLGLGEGVVSGTVDVETISFQRNTNHYPSSKFLTSEEIKKISSKALTMEMKTKYPVDVEWSIAGNDLYILQMRPITRKFPRLLFLDDTNLAESYPGAVSPLTSSFVKRAYRNVFLETAIYLGANTKRLHELLPYYQDLIKDVNNHLYYNLEAYYASLSIMPGGKKNIENWHQMIGGSENSQITTSILPLSKIELVKSIFSILKIAVFRDSLLGRFCQKQEALRRQTKDKLLKIKDPILLTKEVIYLLESPKGFSLTVINDLFIMIGIGVLKKLLPKMGLTESDLPYLLKTNSSLDSLAPLIMMEELRNFMSEEIKQFYQAREFLDIDDFLKQLNISGHITWSDKVKEFMDNYGDRTFQELILESQPLKKNLSLFFSLLNGDSVKRENHKENQLQIKWNIFRPIFTAITAWTKRSIYWREKTRLVRGNYYSLVRDVIDQLYIEITQDEKFSDIKRIDFFTLTRDELIKFSKGETTKDELKGYILKNKNWQAIVQEPPSSLVWAEGEKYSLRDLKIPIKTDGILRGDIACKGVVNGKPLCVYSPEEATKINNLHEYILVTKTTDPAWVYLMSQCRGLISERGSLLSHTAIIGRELNVPTLVSVKNAFELLKDVEVIELNADEGVVYVR